MSRGLLALRVLRTEGPRAVLDRAWDRLLESRRARSFTTVREVPAGFTTPVLHLSATPPAPRLGGVQALLLRRLTAGAELTTVALLYPVPSAAAAHRPRGLPAPAWYRLEIARGSRRYALQLRGDAPGGRTEGDPGGSRDKARDQAEEQTVEHERGAGLPAAVALADPALEEAVAQAADAIGARALHIEGLAGLPIASLLRLQRRGLRMILSLHDFGAFCPRPHLLERAEPARFCGYSRDPERCLRCLRRDWPAVPATLQAERRGLAGELLAAADVVVHPSEFLRGSHLALFPGLAPERQRVITPAATAAPSGSRGSRDCQGTEGSSGYGNQRAAPPPIPRRAGSKRGLHVAFIGSVQQHKGALVFEEVVRLLARDEPRVRWSVYGGGDAEILARLRRLPRTRVRGYYRAGALPALLLGDRVDLALLLSIVPESYGLTLDECAAAGVPAAAFDHGALAARVPARGGVVLPLAGGAGAVAALVADLASGARELPAVRLSDAAPAIEWRAEAAAWDLLYAALGHGEPIAPSGSRDLPPQAS